jgi:hypothetical protein
MSLAQHQTSTVPTVSGRKVVAAMFGFGIVMVAALWIYWELYTRPFRRLQTAIAAEFPGSRPGIVGGRHKSHKEGSTQTLRITIWIEFDPTAETQRAQEYALRLVALAEHHEYLVDYEVLEIRLIQRVGDSDSRMWMDSRPVTEWEGQLRPPP